jgi:hypothetical protein
MIASEIIQFIDTVIHSLQHPFFMVVGGLIFWFALVWSKGMDARKAKGVKFWADQKDEIVVAFIGGLLFLVWDDEILSLFSEVDGDDIELEPYYYLIVAPAIDWIYWASKKIIIKK